MQCILCLGQPPRFILEPQDAVLPTARGTDSVTASIHCSHDTPNTTLVWFCNGVALTYTDTRILHDNGTVEFRPLIALIDVSAEGVRYQSGAALVGFLRLLETPCH